MEDTKKSVPRHVPENWLYHENELTGAEANQIIEEIVAILTKEEITTMTAKQVLVDTIKAIDKEAILGDRRVDGVIIQVDRSSREENEPDVQNQDKCSSQDEQLGCEHNSSR